MTIPYLHPLVVHFPIVLIVVGALGALAWGVTATAFARRFALMLLALGSVGAFVARQTGPALERSMEGDPAMERYVADHATAGNWALGLALLTTAGLGWAEIRARRAENAPERWPLRVAVGLLALGAAAAVVRAGHLGGLMVWGVSASPEATQ